jgi:ribosomal protein L40E
MFTFALIMFIIVAVLIVTAVLFGTWVVVSIMRGAFRTANWVLHGGRRPTFARPNDSICTRAGCGAVNPVTARFCRRCGQQIEATKHRPLRAAAIL